MAAQQHIGSRMREKRLDRGLKQAAVAETVGISPSYLNLIEHNRRRIGGKLLADIARALDVDPTLLMQGAGADMLDAMRVAAADVDAQVELDRTEEIAARYPGWSALIADQSQRIAALQGQVQAMSDRMTSDPHLAASLHDVISAVSAIRSSASILVGPEKLDADWQRRFHENIHSDSLRLATSSEALITYLEAPNAEAGKAAPLEQVAHFLAQTDFHLAALEDPDTNPQDIIDQSGLSAAAQTVFADHIAQYRRDMAMMPLTAFVEACLTHNYDPALLAQTFNAPFSAVLRRLASLPPEQAHPSFGLVVCDAAGAVTVFKPVAGFSLPRAGGGCPLWPLYAALSRPAQPLRLAVALPGPSATPLLCFAVADAHQTARFDLPPPVQSTMLVMRDPPQTDGVIVPVGVSCRSCPRASCRSRREPAMARVLVETAL